MVAPLRKIMREEWIAQGRPKKGKVCPPRAIRQTGLLALNTMQAMGHKTPTYRTPGAARITQDRYTHMLPGELERARELFDAFLAEREQEDANALRR